jgi:hypothetical protein
VQYLIDAQLRDGSWGAHAGSYPAGQTGLSTYTLLKCGVSRRHPAVVRGITNLEGQDLRMTYSLACTLMAVGALGEAEHVPWMEGMAEILAGWQGDRGSTGGGKGLWAYPLRNPDLSNTQYALLGLHAARRAGIEVPRKVWTRTMDAVLDRQERPYVVKDGPLAGETIAGFIYSERGQNAYGRPTGSMTTAGIALLALCELGLGGDIPTGLEKRATAATEHGLAWLAQHFSVTENPRHESHLGYYLYGLERVGALLAIDVIGEHDWYWEGARHLVKKQGAEGMWENETETCFALLFLSRATASSTGPVKEALERLHVSEGPDVDVRWRGTGQNPITLWITGFGTHVAEQYGDEDARGLRVLRVLRVDYLCDGALVQSVDATSNVAWEDERFAVRHEFPGKGDYSLQAKVVVRQGPGTAEILSEPFRVRVHDEVEDWMTSYAREGALNLLASAKTTVKASSHVDKQEPAKAIDGLHGTAWIAGLDDATPMLTIEFRRAVRVSGLAFSPVNKGNKGGEKPGQYDRPTLVHIYVNRAREPLAVELVEDEERKSFYSLPETPNVRRLRIQIMERVAGSEKAGSVGFSEVELFAE